MPLTRKQHDTLLGALRASRVATRSQGGKTLSYLESYDVRAHLIRMFGFTNFDVIVEDCQHVETRPYESHGDNPKPMVEVIWQARIRLNIRDENQVHLATYVESAVGSASGPPSMLGEHHDNAVKTAASDALKRCAINLGTQFGLSLYKNGSTNDVVRAVLVAPDPVEGEERAEGTEDLTPEQIETLAKSLGAKVEEPEEPNPDHTDD